MVLQFSSAVILLIGIQTMQSQIKYMLDQDPGFEMNNVIHMGSGNLTPGTKLVIKEALERYPEIEVVSLHHPPPGLGNREDSDPVNDPGSPFHGMQINYKTVDTEFFDLYDLDIIMGEDVRKLESLRQYDPDTEPGDDPGYFIVNETFYNVIRSDARDPIGYKFFDNNVVMGVVEDFHYQSLKQPIKPLFMRVSPKGQGWTFGIKVNGNNPSRTIRKILNEVRDELSGPTNLPPGLDRSFRFGFIEDTFNSLYEKEKRMRTATIYFSGLAVIIAILGLFGLSTFLAQRRTKEVGIRKALGASDNLIFITLAKEFIKWVAISVIIGIPVGWFLMDKWLDGFAYQAEISVWVYILTAIAVFAVSIATVAWHSIKTSRANPVDALRFE